MITYSLLFFHSNPVQNLLTFNFNLEDANLSILKAPTKLQRLLNPKGNLREALQN